MGLKEGMQTLEVHYAYRPERGTRGPWDTSHMHTKVHTHQMAHKAHRGTQGTQRHTRDTEAHKEAQRHTEAHKGHYRGTQGTQRHTEAHKGAHRDTQGAGHTRRVQTIDLS